MGVRVSWVVSLALHGFFLSLLVICSIGTGAEEEEVITVDVRAAKYLLDSGYGYLDVRTVEEYKKGHPHAAKIFNIPYMFNTSKGRVKNPDFLKKVTSLCKEEDRYVVGCQSGVRSLYATADLLRAGFNHVSNMGGGYLAWVQNGFTVKVEDENPEDQEPRKAEL